MIGLIGKKIGMTQIFDQNGKVTPVTVIQAGPCRVVQRKTEESDGYNAVQLGFEEVPEKRLKKPQINHFKKHKSPGFRYLKEFRLSVYMDIEEDEVFDAEMFVEHELVTVTGTSKGRGFAGVMKRHGFGGFEQSHGVHESYRGPGSIGQCATPSRVHKGKKMAGHMGVDRVTVKNLEVVKVDKERNLVMIKGAVPGHRNSIVYLRKEL
ncbi:MAG: 50S ribosomal protein L3 [Candidatus Cloacimonadota bacterium]|nr:ribosomal protein L3 [uncultured bacterium]PID30091.1 MAG: 50S ribosomal protein L3 [Candidatus Cloacimonadota bacterium]